MFDLINLDDLLDVKGFLSKSTSVVAFILWSWYVQQKSKSSLVLNIFSFEKQQRSQRPQCIQIQRPRADSDQDLLGSLCQKVSGWVKLWQNPFSTLLCNLFVLIDLMTRQFYCLSIYKWQGSRVSTLWLDLTTSRFPENMHICRLGPFWPFLSAKANHTHHFWASHTSNMQYKYAV